MSVSSSFNDPVIKIAENLINICKDETVNPFVRETQIEDSIDQIKDSFSGMKYDDCQRLNKVLEENLRLLATLKEKTRIPNYQKELFETLDSTVKKNKEIVNNHLKIQDLLQKCERLEKDQSVVDDGFIEDALEVFKNPQKYEQETLKAFGTRIQRLIASWNANKSTEFTSQILTLTTSILDYTLNSLKNVQGHISPLEEQRLQAVLKLVYSIFDNPTYKDDPTFAPLLKKVQTFTSSVLERIKDPQLKLDIKKIHRIGLTLQANELNKFWDHFQKSENGSLETEKNKKIIEETEKFIDEALPIYQILIQNPQPKKLSEEFITSIKKLGRCISNSYNLNESGRLSKRMQNFLNISLSDQLIVKSALRLTNKDFLNDSSFNTVASSEMSFFDQGSLELEYIKRLNEGGPLKDLKIDINKILIPRLIKRLNLTNCEISLVEFSLFENLEYLDLHNVQGLSVEQINSLPKSLKEITWPYGFDVSGVDFSRFKNLKYLDLRNVQGLSPGLINSLPESLKELTWPYGFDVSGVDFSRFKNLKGLDFEGLEGLSPGLINSLPESLEALTLPDGFDVSGVDFSRFKNLKALFFEDLEGLSPGLINSLPESLEVLEFPYGFDVSGVDFFRFKKLKGLNLYTVQGLSVEQINSLPESLEVLKLPDGFDVSEVDFSRFKPEW